MWLQVTALLSPAGLPKGIGSPLSALLVAGAPNAGVLSGTCADDGLPPCDACGAPAGFAGRAAATPANAGAMAAAEPKGSLAPDSGAFAKSACCRVSRTACRCHSHEHCITRPPACCLTAPPARFAQKEGGDKIFCCHSSILVQCDTSCWSKDSRTVRNDSQSSLSLGSGGPSGKSPEKNRCSVGSVVSRAHLPGRA